MESKSATRIVRLALFLGWSGFLVLPGCSSTPAPADAARRLAPPPGPVLVRDVVPYYDEALIAANIRRECRIDEQLSEFIASYGRELGVEIVRRPTIEPAAGGTVLEVHITNAISAGNAWVGHRKTTQIAGTLYRDGEPMASFTGLRNSGGGFGGGFKGSCSVLGRTVKALGRDVAHWLRGPVDEAHLGD